MYEQGSLDAFDGRMEPFEHNVHAIRPHNGQIETARNFRELTGKKARIKERRFSAPKAE